MDPGQVNGRRAGILLDILLIILSFLLVFVIQIDLFPAPLVHWLGPRFSQTLSVTLIAWVSALVIAVEYPVRRAFGFWVEFGIVVRVNAVALLIFGALTFLFKIHDLSRMFVGIYFVVTVIAMILSRLLVRLALGKIRAKGRDARTRLLVGWNHAAEMYIQSVEQRPDLGIRISGCLTESGDTQVVVPCLGSIGELGFVLDTQHVNGVVITLPVDHPQMGMVLKECDIRGVPVEVVLDGFSSRLAYSSVSHTLGVPRLLISQTPHSDSALLWKRITDVVISGLALLILSPVLLLIALAIKLDDGGPVLFVQTRSGQYGKPFRMHKFRSMSVDAEKRRQELLAKNEMSGPVFKMKDDPRITRVGRWLRKLSLDELPQFYDVFTGHMSLVGPRPPLPDETSQYDAAHRGRLSVKPGITCLWQISGRNNIGFDQWVDLDLMYIDNWSYWSDIQILLKAVPAVLLRRGAH